MANINRRSFLNRTAAAGVATSLGGLTSLASQGAWAADTSGYKAMVCILLLGGMDHADTILPYDVSSLDSLRDTRQDLFSAYNSDNPGSSRNRSNLLELQADNISDFGGRQYALPPALSGLHSMFDDREMAVVGSVGPLIETVTRPRFEARSAVLPPRLFSHNDQQSLWMRNGIEGTPTGWGGRFADAVIASDSANDPLFTAMAPGAGAGFLTGVTARSHSISTFGVSRSEIAERGNTLGFGPGRREARDRIREYLLKSTTDSNNILLRDTSAMFSRGVSNADRLFAARRGLVDFTTAFPGTRAAAQLRTVAETIRIQSRLNVTRQLFFVTIGGWDTHSNQTTGLAELHTELSQGLVAFRSALQEIDRWDDVVAFTASDFGRTLVGNGNGTDHGWGGHHFVCGGAVNGKRIYGNMPAPDPRNDEHVQSRGRLIPTTSVEQYAATLGAWFGLDNDELDTALPNLANFGSRNLGFI